MRQAKCKCGKTFTVDSEQAQHIVCPYCQAVYKIDFATQVERTQLPDPVLKMRVPSSSQRVVSPSAPQPVAVSSQPAPAPVAMPKVENVRPALPPVILPAPASVIAPPAVSAPAVVRAPVIANKVSAPAVPVRAETLSAPPRIAPSAVAVEFTDNRESKNLNTEGRSNPRATNARPMTSAASPSASIWLAAAGGAAFLLAAILFLVGPLRTAESRRPALLIEKATLEARLKTAMEQAASERRQQEEVKNSLKEELKRSADLKFDDEMLDRRFSSAASQSGLEIVEKQRAEIEQARSDVEKEIKSRITDTDSTTVIAKAQKTVIVVKTEVGFGSGFVFTEDGIAATNYHVVEGSHDLKVEIQLRNSRDKVELAGAQVIAADPEHDLALIKLPPAPASVGEGGKYLPARMRLNSGVSAGENVFAIGNPGFEAAMLDYTVTTGIVSNTSRMLGNQETIQVSAPVNPGNSGGPLFDVKGGVVGVVSAKGVNVEAVTFAIPVQTLETLFTKREDEPFVVRNSFHEWETKHNPLAAMATPSDELKQKFAIKLEGKPDAILMAPDGRNAYVLMGDGGKIQEFNMDTRKLGRIFKAGFPLSDMTFRGNGGLVALASKSRKLLSLDARTLTLEKDVTLRADALAVSYLGGANDYVVLTNPLGGAAGESFIVGQTDFQRNVAAGMEMPRTMLTLECATNNRWAAFFSVDPGTRSYLLRIYPQTQCVQIFSNFAAYRISNTHVTNQQELMNKLDGVLRQLNAIQKVISLPLVDDDGPVAGSLLFADTDRLLLGRTSFKIGGKVEIEGKFEANPAIKDADAKQRRALIMADNLISVSSNGKWAASGTHIYDVTTRRIVKKLPFVCMASQFSKDGKTIVLTDPEGQCIFPITDWEKNLQTP